MTTNDADFYWHRPDQIADPLGSALTRKHNPLHEIMQCKQPKYTTEVIEYIKQACLFTKSDSYVIQSTSGNLKKIFGHSGQSVDSLFNQTITSLVCRDWAPKTFTYPADYTPQQDCGIKSRAYYNLTKLYEFYTNPPKFWRTPFSVGTDNMARLFVHPGNFRLLSTLFLPDNIACCILVPTNNVHIDVNMLANQPFVESHTLLKLDHEHLAKILNIDLYAQAMVRYSATTGIQLVEDHATLPEHCKEYTIEWTGRHFTVNNVIIVTLKNGVFIPPKPLR